MSGTHGFDVTVCSSAGSGLGTAVCPALHGDLLSPLQLVPHITQWSHEKYPQNSHITVKGLYSPGATLPAVQGGPIPGVTPEGSGTERCCTWRLQTVL